MQLSNGNVGQSDDSFDVGAEIVQIQLLGKSHNASPQVETGHFVLLLGFALPFAC